MKEEWRDVPSYPGLKASSWGRVLLPKRTAPMPNGGYREYIPKPTYGHETGPSKEQTYRRLFLRNKFYGNISIHRAVCEAFHGPAPEGRPVVIHKDEDSLNNRPENLKWGTLKENSNAPGFVEYCYWREQRRREGAKCLKKTMTGDEQ